MIVLDSPVLVGIIHGEPDARGLLDLIETEYCVIDAPTLVEARLWCSVNLTIRLSEWLEHFIEKLIQCRQRLFPSAAKWQT